ncbi:MAG TPA: DNA polymerase III subunit beta, partial [Candidatus Cloacimonas sp.]|nr:DNA polymerase III subunit beta [Candidatus Cloacimonas sp.]
DTGEAKEDIDEYNYSGNSTGISFNFKYMLSILEAIDTEKVVINLGTSKDPMMIYNETPVPDQELTFLLMPLRS